MTAPSLILVCDDHANIAQSVVVILSAAGYRARAASSALDCVALAREERPALILMDVMMPGIDGTLAASMFHDEPQFEGVPVALLSAMPEEELRAAAADSGAAAWLAKPFRKDGLLALVRQLAGDPPPRAEAG